MAVTRVSNSLIFGGWVTKVLKEWRQKIRGRRVGDNNILTFLSYDKKCHFPIFFNTGLPVH